MTEIEILRKADEIVRARMELPATDHEREVFRETITGLLWVRTDLVIEEYAAILPVQGNHAEVTP